MNVDGQEGAGRLDGVRVRMVGAGQPPGEAVRADSVRQLFAYQLCLRFDVESTQDERHLVAVAAQRVRADLDGVRWRRATYAADFHPVRSRVGELDGVEPGHHVRAEIVRCTDLVQQLGGDGLDGDRATGARMFGDDG